MQVLKKLMIIYRAIWNCTSIFYSHIVQVLYMKKEQWQIEVKNKDLGLGSTDE